jgi:hypothetical protein
MIKSLIGKKRQPIKNESNDTGHGVSSGIEFGWPRKGFIYIYLVLKEKH